jgi:hypothetical protein
MSAGRAHKRAPDRTATPKGRKASRPARARPAKARTASPARGRGGAAPRPARGVEDARRGLDRAAEAVRAAAATLAQVVDRIGEDALESERAGLASELASEQILRDLVKLQRAFAVVPQGTLPAELEALRTLPEAILDWAWRRLGVTPHLAVGQELEIPPDRLSSFALEGTLPTRGGLVRVRILAPGWKRGARVLVPPRAMIVQGP